MWKAGKKHGVKIIYGIEAYFANDMDGNSAVIGKSSLPLDAEFVAFDIETTGLNAMNDRIIEIGAVIIGGGEVKQEFDIFVNPGMPIPPNITELTGIKDSDVEGAPDELTALRQFMAFAGDRPLIAHNAHFDVGFMTATAQRNGVRFLPVFMDTLALSQALCPELKRFKLDTVSNHLGLPKFNHHRACDDARVCGQIMLKFIPLLLQQGAKTVDDIEKVYHNLKRTDVVKTHHMILLVKNKVGLKHLYEMISQSYLKYFHRTPVIPKSLLIQHRDGILVGYMHSRQTAQQFESTPCGNARAFQFSDEPIIRMRNTAIHPGTSGLEEMIASVEDGYYFTDTNNGQADTNGEFMFGVTMGYEIKNGKLGRALLDTTISGIAFDMLKTVDMVSDSITWCSSGMCGKKQPMPVGMGGPALRCRLTVGGR